MSKWVTSWGVPASYIDEGIGNYVADTTVRCVFYNGIKGERVRLRFTNQFGEEDVKLDAITFGEWTGNGPCVIPETLVEITMNDGGNVIKAGEELITDTIDYTLVPGKNYVISYYFKDLTPIGTGFHKFAGDKLAPIWIGRGNFVNEKEVDLKKRREATNYIFLNGVDVLSTDDTNAVMAFGDSITVRPWPDLLMRRINGEGITNRSVVRKAIGGNRVLRNYTKDCLVRRRMGLAAIKRFETSIKQVLGVDKVIMLEGINDILHPLPDNYFCEIDELPTAEELIEGYKKCCDIAHKYGAKFYLCTILPTRRFEGDVLGKEAILQKVNQWIRTNDYIDGYIEFADAVKDSDNPSVLATAYDSGDMLHPSLEGSQMLCDTVPEHIFK